MSNDEHNNQQPDAASSVKNNKKHIYLIIGALLVAVLAVVIALVIRNSRGSFAPPEITGEPTVTTIPTEEENATTNDTLSKYAEINIEGYKEGDYGEGIDGAIVVSLKNKSHEKASITFEVVAINENGEIVDSSFVSAENLAPGENRSFPLFIGSAVPIEKLKNMDFRVYRALTYDSEPEPTEEASTEEIPAEETNE